MAASHRPVLPAKIGALDPLDRVRWRKVETQQPGFGKLVDRYEVLFEFRNSLVHGLLDSPTPDNYVSTRLQRHGKDDQLPGYRIREDGFTEDELLDRLGEAESLTTAFVIVIGAARGGVPPSR